MTPHPKQVTLNIDGKSVTVPEGTTVLQAELVEMMQSCPLLYSFMGQLTETDKVTEKVTRTPILIIPEAEDISAILRWQEDNSVVEAESGFFPSGEGVY